MSLLPVIVKLSIDGRSSTATTSVPPSRRSSTSRKKPVAYSARSGFLDAALVEPVADVDRQVVVDRAFGDALQALDADVADGELAGLRLREDGGYGEDGRQGGRSTFSRIFGRAQLNSRERSL